LAEMPELFSLISTKQGNTKFYIIAAAYSTNTSSYRKHLGKA